MVPAGDGGDDGGVGVGGVGGGEYAAALARLQEDNRRLGVDLDQALEHGMAALDQLEAEKNSHEQDVLGMMRLRQQLDTASLTCESRARDIERYKRVLAATDEDVRQQEVTIKQLKTKHDILKRERDNYAKLAGELRDQAASLEADHHRATCHIEELEHQLKHERRKAVEATTLSRDTVPDAHLQHTADLRKQIAILEAKSKTHDIDRRALQLSAASYKADLDGKNSEVEALTSQVASLRERLEILRKERDDAVNSNAVMPSLRLYQESGGAAGGAVSPIKAATPVHAPESEASDGRGNVSQEHLMWYYFYLTFQKVKQQLMSHPQSADMARTLAVNYTSTDALYKAAQMEDINWMSWSDWLVEQCLDAMYSSDSDSGEDEDDDGSVVVVEGDMDTSVLLSPVAVGRPAPPRLPPTSTSPTASLASLAESLSRAQSDSGSLPPPPGLSASRAGSVVSSVGTTSRDASPLSAVSAPGARRTASLHSMGSRDGRRGAGDHRLWSASPLRAAHRRRQQAAAARGEGDLPAPVRDLWTAGEEQSSPPLGRASSSPFMSRLIDRASTPRRNRPPSRDRAPSRDRPPVPPP